MNHANLDRSERLQRVLAYLSDGREHTTRDIIRGTGQCAINSIAAEIRAQGHDIRVRREGRRWFYRRVSA